MKTNFVPSELLARELTVVTPAGSARSVLASCPAAAEAEGAEATVRTCRPAKTINIAIRSAKVRAKGDLVLTISQG
jgi:hypothetical protein